MRILYMNIESHFAVGHNMFAKSKGDMKRAFRPDQESKCF